MYSVNCNNSCEWVMDSITFCEWIRDITIHMEVNTISTNNSWLTTVSELSVCNVGYHTILGFACHHEMWTILAFPRCGITFHKNISGQESNLSSHFDTVTSISFDSTKVFIRECFINCYLSTSTVNNNVCNSSSFGKIVIKISGSNNNLLADFPINKISEIEFIVTWNNCICNHTPGFISWGSIHWELACHASNTFISEHWLLFSIITSIHNKCKFVFVRFLLSSCSELSTIESDEICMNFDIWLICKNKFTTLDNNTIQSWSCLINI